MIPYAGFDPTEDLPGYWPSRKDLMGSGRRQRAYVMFRAGRDTYNIALAIGVDESRVLEWISIERSDRLGLPVPYI